MPRLSPEDVVRLLFEAHPAGGGRRLVALMGLDRGPAARRIEVQAHRFVREGDDVLAFGRLRVFEDGALADSPAAWRFVLRDGLVLRIEPFAESEADVVRAHAAAAA